MKENNKETPKENIAEKIEAEIAEVCCEDKNSKKHYDSGFGAIFLLTIGVILLFNNFGILPWGVWGTLWRFWPVLLIFWGLEAIFGKNRFTAWIVGVVSLAILGAIVITAVSNYNLSLENWIQQRMPAFKQIKKDIPYMEYDNNYFEVPSCRCGTDFGK
jgi:hypothetical protein